MVARCAMVLLSVFGLNVQKHRRSSTLKDVIDIGIEIASTCKLTSNGLSLDNTSKDISKTFSFLL